MNLRANCFGASAVMALILVAGEYTPAMAQGFYGDGSSGALVISADTDWTTNPPPVNHAMNLLFTTVTVNAKWTIPSGLLLRTTGDFVVSSTGSIVVANPPAQYTDPGVTLNGRTVGALRAMQILRLGIVGGTSATSTDCSVGAAGGGTLGLRIGGNFQVDGVISATGAPGTTCTLVGVLPASIYGSGGGGGGVFIAAVQGNMTGTGSINVSGGNGGNGTNDGQDGAGGGGGIIHIICPNPVPPFNFLYAGGTKGSGLNSPTGGEAGASGGNGGGYQQTGGAWVIANGGGGIILFSQPTSPEAYFSN